MEVREQNNKVRVILRSSKKELRIRKSGKRKRKMRLQQQI